MPEAQKRVALVNDLTGFGRCSVAVQLPVVSAMRVQGCPLPTALLSVHTGFPDWVSRDCTDLFAPWTESWRRTGLSFDAVLAGWLGSVRQVGAVEDFVREFKKPGTLFVMDPVMGDNGRLYGSHTPELCERMRALAAMADVLTPNLTEACRLLGRPWPEGGAATAAQLAEMAEALSALGPRRVVVTGVADPADASSLVNYVYERGRPDEIVRAARIGGDRSGAGDVFSAVVAAALVRGRDFAAAVRDAAAFVSRCVALAEELRLPWNWGLPVEEFLSGLA